MKNGPPRLPRNREASVEMAALPPPHGGVFQLPVHAVQGSFCASICLLSPCEIFHASCSSDFFLNWFSFSFLSFPVLSLKLFLIGPHSRFSLTFRESFFKSKDSKMWVWDFASCLALAASPTGSPRCLLNSDHAVGVFQAQHFCVSFADKVDYCPESPCLQCGVMDPFSIMVWFLIVLPDGKDT